MLSIKKGLGEGTWISLGEKNRIDFVGGLECERVDNVGIRWRGRGDGIGGPNA